MVRIIGSWLLTLLIAAPAGAEVLTVERTQVLDQKAVFGVVSSTDTTLARARIGGNIHELKIDEGSAVRAGQLLATIVDEKLPLALAALDSRRTSLLARQRLSRTVLDRVNQLRQKGAVSQASLDEAQTDLDVVDAELATLQAERAVLVQQMREGDILAPASGRVLQVNVTEGSVVQAGEVVATIAADGYVLRLKIPERHARSIKLGDPVRVGSRGLAATSGASEPGPSLPGLVTKIYPEIEGGRVVADVAVEGMGDYFVGERARVWIGAGERPAIVIPQAYLINRFGLTYVQLENGAEVVVQTATARDANVEILSGLDHGDRLVLP